MPVRCCNSCGQPLPEIRLGIRLTPLKARIFDIVKRAGPDGINKLDLLDIVFPYRDRTWKGLRAHIWQINDLIREQGWEIKIGRPDHRGAPGGAYLRRFLPDGARVAA